MEGECREWVVIAIFIGFSVVCLVIAPNETRGSGPDGS